MNEASHPKYPDPTWDPPNSPRPERTVYSIYHENVVECNGQSLTPALLELLVAKINEHGQVLLLNAGRSSVIELALALLQMAKQQTEWKPGEHWYPYPKVPTTDTPYTGDTPLPTYVPDAKEGDKPEIGELIEDDE
jgi:hypothetical protein